MRDNAWGPVALPLMLQPKCDLLLGKFTPLHVMTPFSKVKIMPEIPLLNGAVLWGGVTAEAGNAAGVRFIGDEQHGL